jgi:hypothetical protein
VITDPEKYLSYALALDVEQNWAREFSVDLTNATLGMPSPLASDLSNHRTDVEESCAAVSSILSTPEK